MKKPSQPSMGVVRLFDVVDSCTLGSEGSRGTLRSFLQWKCWEKRNCLRKRLKGRNTWTAVTDNPREK